MENTVWRILGWVMLVLFVVTTILRVIPKKWHEKLNKKWPWFEELVNALYALGNDLIGFGGASARAASKIIVALSTLFRNVPNPPLPTTTPPTHTGSASSPSSDAPNTPPEGGPR